MFVDEEPDACDRHFSRNVLFLVGFDGTRDASDGYSRRGAFCWVLVFGPISIGWRGVSLGCGEGR